MSVRDDIIDAKKEIEQLKGESLASEIIADYKKDKKRLFVIILVILSMWFLTIGYLVYVLNDIGTTIETSENTQELHDFDTIDGSYIINGDNYGYDKTND